MRTKAERRRNSVWKALRRRRLDRELNGVGKAPAYDNLHQYSENGISPSAGVKKKTGQKVPAQAVQDAGKSIRDVRAKAAAVEQIEELGSGFETTE